MLCIILRFDIDLVQFIVVKTRYICPSILCSIDITDSNQVNETNSDVFADLINYNQACSICYKFWPIFKPTFSMLNGCQVLYKLNKRIILLLLYKDSHGCHDLDQFKFTKFLRAP